MCNKFNAILNKVTTNKTNIFQILILKENKKKN